MGLLDRWSKKITSAKLKNNDDKSAPVKAALKSATAETKTENKGETKVTAVSKTTASKHFNIVIRPLVTEKSARAESVRKYTFIVAASANKTEVKNAVKNMYGVLPVSVNIVNVQGKNIRFGKSRGRRSDFKKAIVTLPKGEKLTVHEGV
ncbi:MAG: 50S ribosomal protein L23 [Candidatus Magasanikbacteria bacterium]|nr:50S ribosomal protein L23 [Candidatus Magasanikbacteria bacterium]